MNNIDALRQKVEALYKAGNPNADVWINWAYENHVLFVANYAENLALKHHARIDYVVAGALLHDIADVVMDRDTPEHESESLQIARRLLHESGYKEVEIEEVLHEIIEPHSCSDRSPTTLEGRIVATADGASHFLTDFYPYFCWQHYGPDEDYNKFKAWVMKKMEKDFTKKIFFDDVKADISPKYEALKLTFTT